VTGFLATTLRRRKSVSKSDGSMEDYEKTFDNKYWSYAKVKYPVPLSTMELEEGEDTPQRMFMSLLIFAGLATSGGCAWLRVRVRVRVLVRVRVRVGVGVCA
jgi:hypothetical protein